MSQLLQVITKNTEITQPEKRQSPFVKKLPETLIFKLLGDPRGKQFYIPMEYYRYQVGPNADTDTRTRPSLASLKRVQSAPENEMKWSIIKQLSALKKENKGDTDEAKALRTMKKMYEPNKKGWFYVIQPGAPEVKAFLFPKTVIDQLFGAEGIDAQGNKRVVPNLLKKIQEQGLSPYDVSSNKCWLKLTKTGTGMGTKYYLEMLTESGKIVHEGRELMVTAPKELPVHERFVKGDDITLADFPDPIDYEAKAAFTEEETLAFIKSQGTVFPERFGKRSRDDADMETGDDGTADQDVAPTFKAAKVDDISF